MRTVPRRYGIPFVLGLTLIAAGSIAPRLGRTEPDPSPPSAVCLECHDGKDASLASTPHTVTGEKPRAACISCHSGDHRHWEGEPETYPMSNPSKARPVDEARLCAHCHQTAHQQNMLEKNVHTRSDVGCSGCHTVHGATHRALLAKPEPGLCLSCHGPVRGEFAKPYRHPVADGVLACSDCHRTLDESRRELARAGDKTCGTCHAEFVGPFVHEHPAALDFSTSEGGCLTCHDPHGSALPRMLKQPFEPPHFQLCTQCHAVPKHFANPFHGTMWAGVPCNDCHVDVHGSNVSRNLLTPSLQGQGCFNAGCHRF